MKLPVTIHRARLGREEFKVIRPARRPVRGVLVDHDSRLDAYLDQPAAKVLAGLWTMAASSPRSLVHLPLRGNPTPANEPTEAGTRQLDLVLLHHSLQFAPSRWKDVRARLDPGRRQTVRLPAPDLSDDPVVHLESRHHRENRDLFHQHVLADTLFMTGSARVFRDTARHFVDVAREGPLHSHFCTTIHSTAGVLGNGRSIHVEYCDAWVL
ncbi:hypothetical protein DEJ51_32135 [Streptomyces venezuelae]|uniref:Uncharacterized protein n=1 Tax=Streptomyces venezuelae TaxID=54571 RepID=A0A5P2DV47_STRVZ|nr:hypothetical protein [Streptomyces venezuelae]QES58217.1 hypothetical protein DEJ51_32135 [Streptomyces venezuelae]